MSEFYATVYGRAETPRTATGTKKTGIHTSAQSYHGSVMVQLDMRGEEVYCTIGVARGTADMCKHHLWEGPLAKLLEDEAEFEITFPTYRVFHRTWWKENPAWPNGLEPEAGIESFIGFAYSRDEARQMCAEWNEYHDPGRLSDKAEFARVEE